MTTPSNAFNITIVLLLMGDCSQLLAIFYGTHKSHRLRHTYARVYTFYKMLALLPAQQLFWLVARSVFWCKRALLLMRRCSECRLCLLAMPMAGGRVSCTANNFQPHNLIIHNQAPKVLFERKKWNRERESEGETKMRGKLNKMEYPNNVESIRCRFILMKIQYHID